MGPGAGLVDSGCRTEPRQSVHTTCIHLTPLPHTSSPFAQGVALVGI